MGSAAASATLPALAAPSWLTRLLPDRYRRPLVWLFFGLVLALGMRLVRDYGSFGDETLCRERYTCMSLCRLRGYLRRRPLG
jgi:hypothetical protein